MGDGKGLNIESLKGAWGNGFKIVIWKRTSVLIENLGFQLFTTFTFLMLMLMAAYAVWEQWWMSPIVCTLTNNIKHGDDGRLDLKAVATYCFIKGTYTVHDRNITHGHDPVYIAQQGIQQEIGGQHVRKYHNYYYWVPYILFLHGLIFRFPYHVWKRFEGKRLSSYLDKKIDSDFTLRTKTLCIEGDAEKYRKFMEQLASVLLEYRRWGLNRGYATAYVCCEALNAVVVLLTMWLTDMFLGGEFRTYTVDVLTHILMDDPFTRTDPLNLLFPKAIKCEFYWYGSSQTIQKRDVFCLLGANLFHEKMFVILWIWYLCLLFASCIIGAYRGIVIMSPRLRARILGSNLYPKDCLYMRAVLEHGGAYADWFLLKRISDNVNPKRFGELCWYMYKELPTKFKTVIEEEEVEVTMEVKVDQEEEDKNVVDGGGDKDKEHLLPEADKQKIGDGGAESAQEGGSGSESEYETETDAAGGDKK